MKKCPHCGFTHGHYSAVEYKPIDDPKKLIIEAYWFCHSCAKIVYESDSEFEPKEN